MSGEFTSSEGGGGGYYWHSGSRGQEGCWTFWHTEDSPSWLDRKLWLKVVIVPTVGKSAQHYFGDILWNIQARLSPSSHSTGKLELITHFLRSFWAISLLSCFDGQLLGLTNQESPLLSSQEKAFLLISGQQATLVVLETLHHAETWASVWDSKELVIANCLCVFFFVQL